MGSLDSTCPLGLPSQDPVPHPLVFSLIFPGGPFFAPCPYEVHGANPILDSTGGSKAPVNTVPSAHRDWFRGGHVPQVDQCQFLLQSLGSTVFLLLC